MPDSQNNPTRAAIDQLRDEYLIKVQSAFGNAIDVVQSFCDLAKQHPDDAELRGLTEILCRTVKQLLNTVTCKVAANGMAADYDKLFMECGNDEGERDSPANSERA